MVSKIKKGHHPLDGRKMRLQRLSMVLFNTAYALKPRFLFDTGQSPPQFVRKPNCSNSETFQNRGFTVSFWCVERINLFFIISNDSVFEQPFRTNCVRQPRFDCIFKSGFRLNYVILFKDISFFSLLHFWANP